MGKLVTYQEQAMTEQDRQYKLEQCFRKGVCSLPVSQVV